jgi:hypothetical protein
MPPKEITATRESPHQGSPSSRVSDTAPIPFPTPTPDSTPDFGQIFAEHMAAAMPKLMAQIRDGVLQSLEGWTPSVKRSGGSLCRNARKKSRHHGPQSDRVHTTTTPSTVHPKCDRCGNFHAKVNKCWFCRRCKKLGHTERYCKIPKGNCFGCGASNHLRNKCPKISSTGASTSGSDARDGAIAMEAPQGPLVITGTFLI